MSTDRNGLVQQIDAATERLLDTVRRLTDDDVRQPSLLPGWTRGHVLTHVARTGDAMCNLLTWARTGVETPAYESQEARDADIEAGAGRTAGELFADVVATAAAFRTATDMLPDSAWHFPVRVLGWAEFPVEQLLVRRLVEVELHHTGD
jgi:maleylpyruvate isomerase